MGKTKAQLVEELENLHTRLAALERSENERKRAEEALRGSEERFRQAMENIPDMIVLYDRDLRIQYINAFAHQITGRPVSDFIGKREEEVWPPEVYEVYLPTLQEALETGTMHSLETDLLLPGGNLRTLSITCVPLLDEEGKVHEVMGITHDLTKRKQAEEALIHERDLLHTLMDNVPDTIYFKDTESRFTRVNQAQAGVLGVPSPEEAVGKTDADFFTPEHAQAAYADEQKIVQTGIPLIGKVEDNRRSDGESRWELTTKVPIVENEQITGIVGITKDITAIKQTESSLAHERDLLHTLMDNAPDLIYFKDTSSRFIRINQAEAEILGVPSPEEAVGKTDADFFTPEHAQAALADEQKIVQTGTPLIGKVEHIRHANGEWRWVLTTKVPIVENGQVTSLVGITRDITEVKQAEEALQRYADRLRLLHKVDLAILSAHSPELIAQNVLQQLGELVPCQRSSVALFDFEANQFSLLVVQAEGKTELKPGLQLPLEHFHTDWEKLRQHQISAREDIQALAQLSPVFQTLIAEGMRTVINVPLIVNDDLIGSLNLAAASAGFFTAEHLEIAQEVAGQLAIAIQQARLYEELQKHSQVLEQAVEEATAELQEAYDALKTLDQLKDSFLSTAAHELRTPLTTIRGFSEILLTRELDEDRKDRYLTMIKDQSQRLADIINDLLDLSKLEAGRGLDYKPEPTDMTTLIAQALPPFIDTSPGHHFALAGLTNVPPVYGDPFRLEQVVRNLLSNAVKYSPAGGNITIYTRVEGSCLEVGIQDEGLGLTPEQQVHLFEKFYRADGSNRSTGSTGLGLAICKLIIEGHGGHIWVESELGAGSTFAFTVPLAGNTGSGK